MKNLSRPSLYRLPRFGCLDAATTNQKSEWTKLNLHQLASLSLDLSNENYEWLHLDGAWAKEAHLKRDKIHTGVQQISSTRGASSHMHNPFLAVMWATTTETRGQAFGFCLLYSGNFLAQIERDNFDVLRIQLGINPFQFKWKLEDGESFDSQKQWWSIVKTD